MPVWFLKIPNPIAVPDLLCTIHRRYEYLQSQEPPNVLQRVTQGPNLCPAPTSPNETAELLGGVLLEVGSTPNLPYVFWSTLT